MGWTSKLFLGFCIFSACAFAVFAGGARFSAVAQGMGSAIDRPDFKIRNLPYTAAAGQDASGLSVEEESMEVSPGAGIESPSNDIILSALPEEAVVRYLDQVDFDRKHTAQELAEKYLGSDLGQAPADTEHLDTDQQNPADARTIRWLMLSDKERKESKLRWFRASKASLSMDEISHYIDLRPYRIKTALNAIPPAALRKVEAPPVTAGFIEKLKMPQIKPLGSGTAEPLPEFGMPGIRPLPGGAPMPVPSDVPGQDRIPAQDQPGQMDIPRTHGVPSSLRNTP